MRLHVLVRFGMWDELIAERSPEDPALYCVTTALTHYARGVALAATGQVAGASASKSNSAPRSRAFPRRATCSTTPRSTSWRSPSRCWTARSRIARRTSTAPGRACAVRSSSTTRCRTTNRGGGCSRPGTRTARSCSNRARSRRRPVSTLPTSGSMRRCPAPAGIRTTSGACAATTSAWSHSAAAEDADALAPQLERALAGADVAIRVLLFLPDVDRWRSRRIDVPYRAELVVSVCSSSSV